MLDTNEQAQRKEGGLAKQRQGVKAVETLHESEKAPRDTPVRMPEQRGSSRGPRCYSCHQFGHVSSKGFSQGSYYGGCFRNCGKFQKTENGDTLVPVRSGKVEGKATNTLLSVSCELNVISKPYLCAVVRALEEVNVDDRVL
ncbi:hypothetical protein EMCRGX_G029270 [Ephydatia muelleri]